MPAAGPGLIGLPLLRAPARNSKFVTRGSYAGAREKRVNRNDGTIRTDAYQVTGPPPYGFCVQATPDRIGSHWLPARSSCDFYAAIDTLPAKRARTPNGRACPPAAIRSARCFRRSVCQPVRGTPQSSSPRWRSRAYTWRFRSFFEATRFAISRRCRWRVGIAGSAGRGEQKRATPRGRPPAARRPPDRRGRCSRRRGAPRGARDHPGPQPCRGPRRGPAPRRRRRAVYAAGGRKG